MSRALISLILVCLVATVGSVQAITVNVPADYTTIQAAIDASANGDSILVGPGTYTENLDYGGKALVIRSTDGPAATTLSPANTLQSLVWAESIVQHGAAFEGFTVSNGGPIETFTLRNLTDFVLQNNIFHDNVPLGTSNTAVVLCENANALVRWNLFYDNGGISCVGINEGNATIINNTMDNNARGFYTISGSGTARNNIVTNSVDYGIWGHWDELTFNNSWNNGVDFDGGASAGATNISVDPVYADTAARDYTLGATSPCIDAGDPNPLYNDEDTTRNDMGYTGGAGNIVPTRDPITLYVPGDFDAIQEALDAAVNLDTVIVGPGTYQENLNYLGKAVIVRSSDGPSATTLLPQDDSQVMIRVNGVTIPGASFEGFTVANGGPIQTVVLSNLSAFLLRDNIFHDNVPAYTNNTSVVLCNFANAVITRNIFYNNGGISCVGINEGTATIINNTMDNNARGFYTISGQGVARNNIVTNSTEYGIWGFWTVLGYNDSWGNNPDFDGGADAGTTNISADPFFFSAIGHDYVLLGISPCIDAGDPDSSYNDPDGTRNDMGALPSTGEILIPTSEWINLYCAAPTLNGEPLTHGTVLRAYDPDGVLCGIETVKSDGSFGFMKIYGDNSFTAADEGAETGDVIVLLMGGDTVQIEPAVVWNGNGEVVEACSFFDGTCMTLNLQAGWNLVSWNIGYSADIETALSGIMAQVEVVLGFDGVGLTYVPELAEFSNLTSVDYSHGYWLYMNNAAELTVCGPAISGAQSIPIKAGWNLVSYWPDTAMTVENALDAIIDDIEVAVGFDSDIQTWMPDQEVFNTLTDMNPGFGYWLHASAPGSLVYPGFAGNVARRNGDGTGIAPATVSDQWMVLYGRHITLDGQSLADGTVIEAVTADGAVCGSGVYNNDLLKMMPVYGGSARLAAVGESLQLRVNGTIVSEHVTWAGQGERLALSALTSGSGDGLPTKFALEQNYPNPFNPTTTFGFALPNATHVRLEVFNILGRRVKTLLNEEVVAGQHKVVWDGVNEAGVTVASGVYFYRLEAGNFVESKQMLLLK
jgi:hypothetical protein